VGYTGEWVIVPSGYYLGCSWECWGLEAMKVHLLTNAVCVLDVATNNVTCGSLNSVRLNPNKTPKELMLLAAAEGS
jgi:hypothetical protein